MYDFYTVVFLSDQARETYRNIEALGPDYACSEAASFFFAEHPEATNARVDSVILQSQQGPSYTSYVAAPPASNYTPYGTPQAASATGYTPYSATECCGTYTPYCETTSSSSVEEAGFTTKLPAAPVPETSYHQTLPNGYAPYRTCRVILPR